MFFFLALKGFKAPVAKVYFHIPLEIYARANYLFENDNRTRNISILEGVCYSGITILMGLRVNNIVALYVLPYRHMRQKIV